MSVVNILQAKSTLSRLVESIAQGHEREIVIARNGRPVAKLVSVENVSITKRFGVAKGKFVAPDLIDGDNEEILGLFTGEKSL